MKESISALMDGELDDRSRRAGNRRAGRAESEAARPKPATPGVLPRDRRCAAARAACFREGFSERVAAALAAEPTVLAPQAPRRRPRPRRWVALAAGVAAVSVVGWLAFATAEQPVVQAAKAPAPVAPKEAQPALVALPSGTNDYLLAHQEYLARRDAARWASAPYVAHGRREPRARGAAVSDAWRLAAPRSCSPASVAQSRNRRETRLRAWLRNGCTQATRRAAQLRRHDRLPERRTASRRRASRI